MRSSEKGAAHDAQSGVGWLFLIGIVVMLFCGIVAAADTDPIEEVTEVTVPPTEAVTEVADIIPPPTMAVQAAPTLPPYDPKFVRTIDENGNLFTIRATYKKVTDAERAEAAARFRAMYEKYLLEQQEGGMAVSWNLSTPHTPGTMDPGGIPQYMGPYGNYAYSPMPWGPITSVTITSPGTGYTLADTVTVIDYWGTGSGANVTIAAVDINGNITALSLNAGGTQYSAPWLIFNSPTGTGASATASIETIPNGTYGHGIRKFIDPIPPAFALGGPLELTSHIPIAVPDTTSYPPGGVGYTSAPTITIYDDTGTGATAVANMAGSTVASVTVTNGGGNYSFHPVVVFEGGGATTQAVAGTPTVVNGVITAIPLTGADYYEIELIAYPPLSFHSDLPNTSGLWGYRQVNMGGGPIHYLGPIIVANRDRPVRINFTNNLPANGPTANLSVPVDFTIMGAGMGPLGMAANPIYFTQNRAAVHLHGGITPWISDGTPFQWTTPNGTITPYQRGPSVYNVPDMPNPGANPPQGSLTFYYTNQQSSRLMFYHDHAEATTRLNVYVGEASGYLLSDLVEDDLVFGNNTYGENPNLLKVLPGHGIPLIIQDKTFVDNATIAYQDPTWNWGTDYANVTKVPQTGDLWVPHVYMPAENPWDPTGVNAFGRWPYAPWEYPERTGTHGPIANVYYDPLNRPWEPLLTPGTPNPSMVPEAFQDTPMVNGAAYPWINVEPKAYRFRILSVADDRFFNLNLYRANASGYTNVLGIPTELDLIPNPDISNGTNTINPVVPLPGTEGPAFWKIGTDGGFLPQPVVVPPQPTTYDGSGNVLLHGLALGPAERADVIVNFSGYEGQTLILYNDAPTPWPGASSLYDFYTGNSDQTSSGGSPPTLPGYGPNSRTIMVFRVGTTVTPGTETPDVNLANLNAVFAKTAGKNGVFEVSAEEIPVPMPAYNSAFNASFLDNSINANQLTTTFTALQGYAVNGFPITDKLIMDAFPDAYDEYGRLIGLLGLSSPGGPTGTIFELYGYTAPPVEFIRASIHGSQIGSTTDGTQIWRINHAGTDTHPIHWHLYTVQPINRINSTDGTIIPIPNDEIGWRETLRISPVQYTIVALRPYSTVLPWDLPNSYRYISPNDPPGVIIQQGPGGWGFLDLIGQPINVVNKAINYGGEFVFHCHILGHEEGDMMHAVVFGDYPNAPLNLTATNIGNFTNPVINLTWIDNSMDETNWTIQRSTNLSNPWTDLAIIPSTTEIFMNVTVFYIDNTVVNNTTYYYRVMATNIMGDTTTYPNNVPFPTLTVNSTPSNTAIVGILLTDKIGVYQNGSWIVDRNGNGVFGIEDGVYSFGAAGYTPVPARWNGTAYTQIGVYQSGSWYLDMSGDGVWGPGDVVYGFGAPGYAPVIGDWNATGKDCIGVFAGLSWFLDWNGNGVWDGTDKVYTFTPPGSPFNWSPVVGDWTGNGTTKIGLYQNGTWNLDMNGDGVYGPGDPTYTFGAFGWTPVLGDWTGNGTTKIGVYLNGSWILDINGDGTFGPGDAVYSFGAPGWTPVLGDWTGNGITKIGVYNAGTWILDMNGDGVFGPGDVVYGYGAAGWTPVIGKWG